MKSYFTFIMLLACALANAQNIDDVLRYSTENLQGTARFQGMGGAFGALGGDLSALNINPAGSAVFNNSLFTVSGSHYNRNNQADYSGTNTQSTSNYLDINQVGGALVFKTTDPNSNWGKIALAINYDVVQDFDNETLIMGRGSEGVDNYFLNFADGVRLEPLKLQQGESIRDAYLDIGATAGLGYTAQQAFLGFQSGIIEPVEDAQDNTAYFSNANYTQLDQRFNQIVSGYNSKFTVNGATEYAGIFNFGASMNFHTISYTRVNEYDENSFDSGSAIQNIVFDNLLNTEGTGFSFSVGAIAQLNEVLRIGGSYQSPTWYRLTDNFSQSVNSDFPDKNPDIRDIDFGLTTIFDYQIKTPGKLTGSVAAVFGKSGLLSFDYGYQDMSQAQLRPTSDLGFASENDFISDNLGGVSSFRVGGEYRIKRISLRGGYRYEQSPYEDGNIVGDLTGISAGIGFAFGGSRLDLAINRTERDVLQYFFDSGIGTPAVLNNVNTNLSLGYTLNF
ncbi:OmpP1/FadL family transporter [Pareuzebyella sediminis]|uniref:OmpP1/FadL family transporter n=1 Tax=Pareuzebyella sediminis TaxID=2607998 RepID=UPI0011EDDBBA|nr:outer membrane protein transport protein [Pareuzebyella sediminis]